LTAISNKFNLGDTGIPLLMLLNPYDEKANTGIDPVAQVVFPGEEIMVPNPGMQLPTATPIPVDLPVGTKITYTIQAGDTLAGIASKYNSTIDDIIATNKLDNPNAIAVNSQIVVRANLATPTPAPASTITPGPSPTPPSPFTLTPEGGVTLTPTATAKP
jgi:LysM repeat protein